MAGTPLKIIVGLGNPGPEHLLTRHNAGFWFVDALAAKAGARFRSHTKFQGEICRTQLSGSEVTLLKTMTYMSQPCVIPTFSAAIDPTPIHSCSRLTDSSCRRSISL